MEGEGNVEAEIMREELIGSLFLMGRSLGGANKRDVDLENDKVMGLLDVTVFIVSNGVGVSLVK